MFLAVDPGPKESAFVLWDGREILEKGICPNEELLQFLESNIELRHFRELKVEVILVIEKIVCYGMAIGDDVLDTIFWSGRLCQAWRGRWVRVPRIDVKMHHCQSPRAKDSNIRQALIDRFGEPGTKREPGITYGLKRDLWQAFALAVYWWDLAMGQHKMGK